MSDFTIHGCSAIRVGHHDPENGNCLSLEITHCAYGFREDNGAWIGDLKSRSTVRLFDLPTEVTDALIEALEKVNAPKAEETVAA